MSFAMTRVSGKNSGAFSVRKQLDALAATIQPANPRRLDLALLTGREFRDRNSAAADFKA